MHDTTYDASAGRVALVTGASRGLGRTLARFLAAHGHDLVMDARGEPDLAATAEELRELGARVIAVPGDVSDEAHRARLVAAAGELGGLDLLVHNASTLGPSPLPRLADVPLDALRRTFEVNVVAPLALTQSALPLLEARRGLVVAVSSDAAAGGYEGWGVYGASKAALDLVAATLAQELADRGVAAVVVDPGDMRTTMHQRAHPGQDISDRPVPDATVPFWAWLLSRPPQAVSGRRYRAQDDVWLDAPERSRDPRPLVV
jgi:NAD(P)-dependent dehydrogenase (short-subunit alcohol dehydrogenase family)